MGKVPDGAPKLWCSFWCLMFFFDIFFCLVGGFKHLEKYMSMGRIIPYIVENKSHVPNHQPAIVFIGFSIVSCCNPSQLPALPPTGFFQAQTQTPG
jgi:hypothetical protein